MYIFTTEDF